MSKRLFALIALLCSLALTQAAVAAEADIEINTPAIASIKAGMKARHAELRPYYQSGAIGLTRDGGIAVHDATLVPLAQRQQLNTLVAAQNKDRDALYREIATANGHPEWEPQVRGSFAERWIQKAPAGWWYRNADGAWVKK